MEGITGVGTEHGGTIWGRFACFWIPSLYIIGWARISLSVLAEGITVSDLVDLEPATAKNVCAACSSYIGKYLETLCKAWVPLTVLIAEKYRLH